MAVAETDSTAPGLQPRPEQQWAELVATYRPGVYRHAYRLTGHRHDAEDLTQDTFIRAFLSPTYRDSINTSGWLYRITINLHIDGLRRRLHLNCVPVSCTAT